MVFSGELHSDLKKREFGELGEKLFKQSGKTVTLWPCCLVICINTQNSTRRGHVLLNKKSRSSKKKYPFDLYLKN